MGRHQKMIFWDGVVPSTQYLGASLLAQVFAPRMWREPRPFPPRTASPPARRHALKPYPQPAWRFTHACVQSSSCGKPRKSSNEEFRAALIDVHATVSVVLFIHLLLPRVSLLSGIRDENARNYLSSHRCCPYWVPLWPQRVCLLCVRYFDSWLTMGAESAVENKSHESCR